MNVLFLSGWFPHPRDNGAKLRVFYLLRALGLRHQVTLISLAFDTADPDRADCLRDYCVDVVPILRNPFERSRLVRSLTFFSPAPIVSAPLPEMTQAIRAALARHSYDVVIASHELFARYALQAPPSGARVLDQHNSMTRWMWERYTLQSSQLRRLRSWLTWQKSRRYERWLFRQFDACLTVSEQDRQTTLDVLGDNRVTVDVVPNGVDCDHNRPGLVDPLPNTLVFNGALTYYANLDAMQYFLAAIYPLIRQQVPDVSLTITGPTAGVDLSLLKLDSSVHFSGYVDDIRPLVAGAWVSVAPIRRGGGTRLKILEAMALGTPVVATTKGAEGLGVADGEQLLLADDPVTFAQRTVGLLCEPRQRARLAANARPWVEQHFDWKLVGDHFTDLIERTVREKGQVQ